MSTEPRFFVGDLVNHRRRLKRVKAISGGSALVVQSHEDSGDWVALDDLSVKLVKRGKVSNS